MGRRIDKLIGTREDRAAHKAARAELNTHFNNPDTDPDDPGYLAANQRVIDAEKKLPRWRHLPDAH